MWKWSQVFHGNKRFYKCYGFPCRMDPLTLTPPTSQTAAFWAPGSLSSWSLWLGKHPTGKNNFSKDYSNKALTTPVGISKSVIFCPSSPLFQTDQKVHLIFTWSDLPACSCFVWIIPKTLFNNKKLKLFVTSGLWHTLLVNTDVT